MPHLHNLTAQDLHAPQIHKMVPAGKSVEVSAEEAEMFDGNQVFAVRDEPADEAAGEHAEHSQPTKRGRAARGGKVAEVTEPPAMESR